MSKNIPQIVTVADLAKLLGVTRPTVYAWEKAEIIPPRDVRRRWWSRERIAAFLAAQGERR